MGRSRDNTMPSENKADIVETVQKPGEATETAGEAVEQAREAEKKPAKSARRKGGRKRKTEEKARILGPVTDQSGNCKSKYRGRGRCNKFINLPNAMRLEGERLLEEGATFEETTEWINEHHAPEKAGESQGVTLAAVTDYFRSNFEMQRRRVRYMQKMAQELKKALKGKADSAMSELAEAVFFTGVMGLNRDTAEFSVKDAKRDHLAAQALRDREQVMASHLKTEHLKRRKMRQEMGKLERALKKGKQGLNAEAMRRIKDIYGLIDQPLMESDTGSGAGNGKGEEANA